MINGINDCESSPASGDLVIKYMTDHGLFPCPQCAQRGVLHPACLPCEKP
jgi:hypothetical protein